MLGKDVSFSEAQINWLCKHLPSAICLWRDFRDYIEISYIAIPKIDDVTGEREETINKLEPFTLRIIVRNKAPQYSSEEGRPIILFKNVKIKIDAADCASPVDSDGNEVSSIDWKVIAESFSTYSQPINLDVPMKAKNFIENETREPIAKIYLNADLDPKLYLKIAKYELVRANIEPRIT